VAITGDGLLGSGPSADATRELTKSSTAPVLKTVHIAVIDCICFQDATSVIHSGKNALLDPVILIGRQSAPSSTIKRFYFDTLLSTSAFGVTN
jgi:hypothetical protein